ncbi:hypothetical protein [Rhodococcus aetherivorans]|uniref:hypothetical protein n=1 Tax=Rhodococcus aetherivorans TaxID=191292 RepID=UPI00045CA27C|nr:hypothetical protein [Rhodococcus aetherivorans]KDE14223.1 hypothetical protein N505_0105205 [Rhodococcus aetherivorans]
MSYDIAAGETIAGAQWGDTTLPDWVIDPARRTVASNARNADDARELLAMLGLIQPSAQAQTRTCAGPCGRPLRGRHDDPAAHPGSVLSDNRHMCKTCARHVAPTKQDRTRACRGCGGAMRPNKASAKDWPGTKSHTGRGYCSGCYHKYPDGRTTKPPTFRMPDVCQGTCGRRLRPTKTSEKEFPGTVGHFTSGMCRTCHRHTQKEAAA